MTSEDTEIIMKDTLIDDSPEGTEILKVESEKEAEGKFDSLTEV